MAYLTFAEFRTRTLLATVDVDYVEADSPGFVAARLAVWTSWIEQRLRKRYGASLPFTAPVPEIILNWLTHLTSWDVLRKRGVNPQDPTAEDFRKDFEATKAEVKEAADSKDGLFDIANPEGGDSNVTTGGPLGYSETSPYVWADFERAVGRQEDAAAKQIVGGGSGSTLLDE